MKRLNAVYSLLSLALFSGSAFSIEPLDNYYADDLLEAVDQAREQPHHYDYSSNYRYKRTTAQSIELNRLDLNELEDTHLTMEQATDSGDEKILASTLDDSSTQLKGKTENQPGVSTPVNIQTLSLDAMSAPLQSHYQNSAGSYTTTGIVQSGSVVSTPRP